ncbi:MFS transporter [Sphaerisporangium siamense]|uniref:EmrB/QacA subfamily drug resistance transporter n=1 Tax=Sphaerisporangium siamense TaxID=795645 RepID=A0A7W7GAB0_9ACTN|nr:MFS transporter [Sphaerisporangium siamense]MBB4703748.1 EmrB/QacA subfamily drug resistance transporter [Sphaerisporangium siamense]GII82216.1 MFS transporter [Sphaerisporangium siamense]
MTGPRRPGVQDALRDEATRAGWEKDAVHGPAPGQATSGAKAPLRAGLALVVIAAAQLMLVLDGTIMNVALPSIQKALALPPADLDWLVTAYALTFGGLLLAGGRAGDLFGRRRVFRAGLVLFAAASLLGGLAPGQGALVAARALQGVGAAVAAPAALSLLATTFPAGPARARALGVYGAMGALGSVAGLLLGGVLTEYLSWRWVLFVNVPIAVLVLAGTSALVDGGRDRGRADLPGALTATAGLAALVYAVKRGGSHGWADTTTIAGLGAAAVLAAGFVLLQRRSRHPMLPGRVLRDRDRAAAYLVIFLVGAGMFATFYFLTLYMQVVREFTAMGTGLAFLPFAAGIGLSAGVTGPRLLARASGRAVTLAGLAPAAGGMAWLALLTPAQGYLAVLLPAQLVAGTGLGLVFVATTVAGVRGVAPEDTGVAAGVLNTAQQVGGAVGLAGLAAVASAATAGAPPGTAAADALTRGHTTGFLVAGALYVAALAVAAWLPRAGRPPVTS